jgi:hypothetical protein
MENLEKYKSRFYNLMESTMGDVKPLITEDIDYQPAQTFFQDVMSILGKKFPDKVKWDTNTNRIYGGNKARYFMMAYLPKTQSISWIDYPNTIVKNDGTNFLNFQVKNQTGQLVPKDPNQLKKEIEEKKRLISTYNFNDLPNSSTPPVF